MRHLGESLLAGFYHVCRLKDRSANNDLIGTERNCFLRCGSSLLIIAGESPGRPNTWRDDQEDEIIATGIPPSNDLESAIVRDLAPGNYTAIVRGFNNTAGVALVEAYDLN
jgi:hypothetical protein